MSSNGDQEGNNGCCLNSKLPNNLLSVESEPISCERTLEIAPLAVAPRRQFSARSRLQSFKEGQEISSSNSPSSNQSSLVAPVDEDGSDLQEGEKDVSGKQNRKVELSAKSFRYYALVAVTSVTLAVSFITASLLGRFYFDRGGNSLWLYTLSQSVGFPVTGFIMILIRLNRNLNYTVSLYAWTAYLLLGVIVAVDNLFYSFSVSCLPISTVGLLGATHVAFTAIFAYVLVKKKLTPFSLNTVILVSLSAVLLELASKSTDESRGKNYALGFAMSILANVGYGLLLPLMELVLQNMEKQRREKKTQAIRIIRELDLERDQKSSEDKYLQVYIMLEMHTYSTAFASAFVFIGMMASGDYAKLGDEMNAFGGGVRVYWISFIGGAVGWQFTTLASLGIIMLTSSLFAGVLNSFNLPFLAVSAIFFFGDKFGGLKVIAMILSLWGFTSYLYGGYLDSLPKGQE